MGDPSLSVLSGLCCSYIIPSDTIQRKSTVLSHRHCSRRQLSCKLFLSIEYCHIVSGSKEPASRVIPGVIQSPAGVTLQRQRNGERTRKARFLLILLLILRRRDPTLSQLFTTAVIIVWLTVYYSLTWSAWYLQAATMSKGSMSLANGRGTWSRSGAITRSLPRF